MFPLRGLSQQSGFRKTLWAGAPSLEHLSLFLDPETASAVGSIPEVKFPRARRSKSTGQIQIADRGNGSTAAVNELQVQEDVVAPSQPAAYVASDTTGTAAIMTSEKTLDKAG